jgi:hypothetical protein
MRFRRSGIPVKNPGGNVGRTHETSKTRYARRAVALAFCPRFRTHVLAAFHNPSSSVFSPPPRAFLNAPRQSFSRFVFDETRSLIACGQTPIPPIR